MLSEEDSSLLIGVPSALLGARDDSSRYTKAGKLRKNARDLSTTTTAGGTAEDELVRSGDETVAAGKGVLSFIILFFF